MKHVCLASFNDTAQCSLESRQMDAQTLPQFPADFHEHSAIIFNARRGFGPKDLTSLNLVTAGIQEKEIKAKIKDAALLLIRKYWFPCTFYAKRVIQTNKLHSFSLSLEYITWQHSDPLYCISLNICPMGKSCEFGLLTE